MSKKMLSKDFNQKRLINRNNSINIYFNDVKKSESLTREEEHRLSEIIRNGGEGVEDAVNKLVTSNLKYIISEAKTYQTGKIEFNEILQQANYGAILAAHRFDSTKGFKFITYMKYWIKQSVLQYISEYGNFLRLPSHQVVLNNRINKFIDSYQQKNGSNPDEITIANGLDVGVSKVSFLLNEYRKCISLDSKISRDDDSSKLIDCVYNEDSLDPMESLIDESLNINLNRAMDKLSYRKKTIIKMCMGINHNREYSLDEIAIKLDLGKERVRQLKVEGLKDLKNLISENELNY